MCDNYTLNLNNDELKYILKALEQFIRTHDLSGHINIRSIKDISKYAHELCDIADLYLKINSLYKDEES